MCGGPEALPACLHSQGQELTQPAEVRRRIGDEGHNSRGCRDCGCVELPPRKGIAMPAVLGILEAA